MFMLLPLLLAVRYINCIGSVLGSRSGGRIIKYKLKLKILIKALRLSMCCVAYPYVFAILCPVASVALLVALCKKTLLVVRSGGRLDSLAAYCVLRTRAPCRVVHTLLVVM